MTDAVSANPSLTQYVQMWADLLAQVLEQAGGTPYPCSILPEKPAELSPPQADDLWIIAALSGALRGEMSLQLSAASAEALAKIFTGEQPGTTKSTAEISPEHRDAAVELSRQVAGLIATGTRPIWGEVQIRLDASESPSWAASSTAWLRIEKEGSPLAWIEIQLSAALVAALRREKADDPPANPGMASDQSAQQSNQKLELLMDVELAVTLRFGARRLLLREILELAPGAVIELDRQVQEPVDILLGGRVVARGEVVILSGNYGLRVTEVAPEA